jgi:DNA-binding NtrC family response regulator
MMSTSGILIADTDPTTLDRFPRIVSDSIPDVEIDICTSAEELSQKVRSSTYETVAITPLFLEHYRKHKKRHQLLTPLLLATSLNDRSVAHTALQEDAFDVIVKPLVEPQVTRAVRLALWQNGLIRFLTSKERALSRFRDHMAAFPDDLKSEADLQAHLVAFERTCRPVQSSVQLLEHFDNTLYDFATAVEGITRKHALDRLLNRL